MAVSKARRAANNKWDKENMTTLGCKVKKADALAFKEYALEQGKTSNTILKEYVMECIKEDASLDETMERDKEQDGGEASE